MPAVYDVCGLEEYDLVHVNRHVDGVCGCIHFGDRIDVHGVVHDVQHDAIDANAGVHMELYNIGHPSDATEPHDVGGHQRVVNCVLLHQHDDVRAPEYAGSVCLPRAGVGDDTVHHTMHDQHQRQWLFASLPKVHVQSLVRAHVFAGADPSANVGDTKHHRHHRGLRCRWPAVLGPPMRPVVLLRRWGQEGRRGRVRAVAGRSGIKQTSTTTLYMKGTP